MWRSEILSASEHFVPQTEQRKAGELTVEPSPGSHDNVLSYYSRKSLSRQECKKMTFGISNAQEILIASAT